MWKLVIEDDEGKRTIVPLTREDYSIGRKEGNTIRLTERNVSREHARIHKKTNGEVAPGSFFTLEDCTSYNGVYVNGLRVAQAQDLTHGDLIQIGDYRIVLQDDTVTEVSGPPPGMTIDENKVTVPTGAQAAARGALLLERPNRLVMLAGPTPGAEFPLTLDRITVGRAEDANVSVNHNSVSRLHCEIHALGEGRFEIVDKGSSNGVHVNGADLKRGIIEAGDIIELGDVRFKFVGAGQIFLPGINDSQQLEAISDRLGSAPGRPRRGSNGIGPVIFVGALLGFIAVGAWAIRRNRIARDNRTVTTATTDQGEGAILADAKRLCMTGDCDTAHDKIIAGIPLGSPLRDSDDFQLIEQRWADVTLARAEGETDMMRKRALLHLVEGAATVDAARRKQASDKLLALDQAAFTPTVNMKDAGRLTAPTVTTARTSSAPTSSTARPPRPAPTSKSMAEAARAIMLSDPSGAKAILVPRVVSGQSTREETELLRTICKELKDTACVDMCVRRLSQ